MTLRIALVSEHASPLATIGGIDSGGQNIYVAQVARGLVAQGHQVDVFTRRDAPDLPAVVDWLPGLRVVHVDAGPAGFVPKERLLAHMPAFARRCAAFFLREIAHGRPYDVLHANFFMSGWVGLLLKRRFGLPLVTTFHALGLVRREHQKEADAFPPERIDIERQLAAASDRIVAECPQDRLDLVRLYQADASRLSMVPCGFDAKEFAPLPRDVARQRLGLPADEFMVLQLGRMVPRKGVETVVRAVAELVHADEARPTRGPAARPVTLRVVGGECDVPDEARTPEIGRLRAIARRCGIEPHVVFEGRKPRADLHLWYAAADVFVTTPWYEPFGITPLEAMACARPVIGSAVGGIRYSVEADRTGLLVPPKDPVALAQAIATLRAQPERARALGEAGLARARTMFTWEQVSMRLAEVYRAAIRDHAGTPVPAAARAAARPALPAPSTAPAPMRSIFHVLGLDAPLPAAPADAPRPPAIFIDKDGTLVEDVPYNVDPALLRFTDRACEAMRAWQQAGYRLVVITNQSGLARGRFDRSQLRELHDALVDRLAREGVTLDGFHACPHAPDGRGQAWCACRKPAAGLLLDAARVHGIDLSRSWMVGDILNDVEAGHRAGCRSVLLDTGHETEWLPGEGREPDVACHDLFEAACAILRAPDADRASRRPDAGEALATTSEGTPA